MLCAVGVDDEGLRDSDEHATNKGVMQALRNKRLFMRTTLLQGCKGPPQ
jgi:hypothetical protein